MSVRVDSVTKIYGKQRALDGVSFTVDSGEIVGFLGPNGAGKSTMMKIITGFLHPDEGSVWINGEIVGGNNLGIRHQIGYLPENNPLYSDLYVTEYLEYVAGIYHIKTVQSRVKEMIGLTGLQSEKHKKIRALSKGYRQRVGIAQALIHDPSVLILDEPTSGLDPSQIVEIRQLIRNISTSKTVMLSTHIMQEVEALCNRIMIINHGKIVATDTPSNIKALATASGQNILVEFAESINPDKLNEIQGIIEIRPVSEKTWLVRGGATDLRPLIFRFAVANNLTILTLNKQESSLENVFLEITR
ncbi:MAG: gliding motility-associated ABC transporter ATP-binding subunit GldA [Bacteroidia bacterium]|nr:gliding motility-associated ABC transporter ATP-binding subunit GldA [Bacteroidia bacterium]